MTAAGKKTSAPRGSAKSKTPAKGKNPGIQGHSLSDIVWALLKKRPIRDTLALLTILGSIFIILALAGYPEGRSGQTGYLGYYTAHVLVLALGYGAWILPIVGLGWAFLLIKSEHLWHYRLNSLALAALAISLLGAAFSFSPGNDPFQASLYGQGGGFVGNYGYLLIYKVAGKMGFSIFVLALILCAALLMLNQPLTQVWSRLQVFISGIRNRWQKESVQTTLDGEDTKAPSRRAPPQMSENPFAAQDIVIRPDHVSVESPASNKTSSANKARPEKPMASDSKPAENEDIDRTGIRTAGSAYIQPSLDLLNDLGGDRIIDRQEIQNKVKAMEQTFANFGIEVKVLEVSCGPVVTRYELSPAPGVKVSRISALADDLQLSLAARGLRLEAPIPGKAAIGIEIPNDRQSQVGLKQILGSTRFQDQKNPLSIALGEDVAGNTVVAALNDMPHVLVAGSTGSGKSVCINAMIMSILCNAHPDHVKLVLIDPKMVELTAYNGIPHLLTPVVTEPKKAARILKWMTMEMEKRYQLFTESGVRDLARYNEKAETRLPQIVVVIDELADLMMVAPGDVEDAICRLAQMARAAGIHLIVSTQRPSVDVITGLIKANIPSRIAFAVSSQVDSRTILDSAGAEKLLGKGDMLYMPIGAVKPIRVQGAFVSDSEIMSVVEFLKNQMSGVEISEQTSPVEEGLEQMEDEAEDPFFWDAVRLVVEEERLSASFLQRKLKVGYSRAARLVDMMEERGIVSDMGSDRKRRILISSEELDQILARRRL